MEKNTLFARSLNPPFLKNCDLLIRKALKSQKGVAKRKDFAYLTFKTLALITMINSTLLKFFCFLAFEKP